MLTVPPQLVGTAATPLRRHARLRLPSTSPHRNRHDSPAALAAPKLRNMAAIDPDAVPAGENDIHPVPTNPGWPTPHVASMEKYKSMWEESINNPDAFWTKVGGTPGPRPSPWQLLTRIPIK